MPATQFSIGQSTTHRLRTKNGSAIPLAGCPKLLDHRRRGWIKAAGPRTGLFFNLFIDPRAAENKLLEAVLRTYPSAIIVGTAVLHAHGWTTQIPHVVDVAVLSRPSIKQFEGVNFVERPRQWYADLMKSPDILHAGESPFAIESVSPAFALADARQRGDVWMPDEDDLERLEESEGMTP